MTPFQIGQRVTVRTTVGGAHEGDEFEVTTAPAQRGAKGLVWVHYVGIDKTLTDFGRDQRPLGFLARSLRPLGA